MMPADAATTPSDESEAPEVATVWKALSPSRCPGAVAMQLRLEQLRSPPPWGHAGLGAVSMQIALLFDGAFMSDGRLRDIDAVDVRRGRVRRLTAVEPRADRPGSMRRGAL